MGIFLKVVLVFFCVLFTIIFSAVGIVPSMILSPTSVQVAQQLGIEEVEFDSQAQITQIANQAEAEINSFANGTTPTLTLSNEELTALIIDQLAKQTNAPELTNISVNVKEENGQPSLAFVATLNSNSLPDDMQDLKDLIGDDTEITIGADIGLIEGSNGTISLGFNQIQIGSMSIGIEDNPELFNEVINLADLGMDSSGLSIDVVNGQLVITQ